MSHLFYVLLVFIISLLGSTYGTNDAEPQGPQKGSTNQKINQPPGADLPPMPSLDDISSQFEPPGSAELISNQSDRIIRSSYYRLRSSSDLDNQANDIPSSKLIKSMNTFTFKLFNYLMEKYDNIVISPISLYANLIALHAASSGSTEAQLAKLLTLTGMTEKQIAEGYRAILGSMTNGLGDRNHLKLFNQMLVDKRIKVSPTYLDKMRKYYDMGIQTVEFSTESEQIYRFVNNLVNYKTEGNIRTIMDQRPDPLSKLLIVNAVHFQGEWAKSFNTKETTLMPFRNKDFAPSQVRMMRIANEFKIYCDHPKFNKPDPPLCSIKIPYAGNQLTMQIIRSANATISLKDSVERRLGPQLLKELDSKMNFTKMVELRLPAFHLEDTHELREPMDFLGANSIFTKDRANLDKFMVRSASTSGTSDKDTNVDLFVNQFKHKASISLSEKGTIASAATSVLIGNRSGNAKFHVDRPFIFIIKDNRSDAILFIGRINNLESEA